MKNCKMSSTYVYSLRASKAVLQEDENRNIVRINRKTEFAGFWDIVNKYIKEYRAKDGPL